MINKEFVTAGKAVFTVDNGKGEWYTFKVRHKEAANGWPEAYFVMLLTGPDNTSDFTYMGMLNPSDGGLRLTAKSKYKDDTTPVKVFRWAMNLLWTEQEFPAGYNVHHEGRCCRCGRALTVPESVETGIGPECAKIMTSV